MRKKTNILGIVLASLFLLSGCGNTLPEMTAQQEDKIVEYAAGIVMRYTNDYESRLVDLNYYSNPEENTATETEKEETGKMDPVADTETVDRTEEGTMMLEQVLLPSGMELAYLGCQLTDSYPDAADNAPYFSLDATEGKSLLVMQFMLKNNSGQEAEVDVFSQKPQSVLLINGTEKVAVMSTMLLDDLNTFIGEIDVNGERMLVMIAETDCRMLEEIGTLKLTVSTQTGKATVNLQ